MSTGASALLRWLRETGAEVVADGDRLRLRYQFPPHPDLLTLAKKHKAALLSALASEKQQLATFRPVGETTDLALAVPAGANGPGDLPPAWADPATLPKPFASCSCCHGRKWWTEAAASKGWRCSTCHPPLHLAADAVRWVCQP